MRKSHVIKELGCINCNNGLSLNFRTYELQRRFFTELPIHQLPCNFCFHCSCEFSMNTNKKVLKIKLLYASKETQITQNQHFFVYLKIAKQDYLYALYLMDELK